MKPNVIYIYADDMGRGMLSCYGQKHFKTPNIDKLFSQSMSFSNAYGCHICAPARASLLCGIHDCHAGRWSFTKAGIYKEFAKGNMDLDTVEELINNTGIEKRANDVYLPTVFKKAGYVTGQIGKLEWGFATTNDDIKSHDWDYHYGYYDHEMCHGYYPPFVFENGEVIYIEGNTDPDCGKGPKFGDKDYWSYKKDKSDKAVYSQDLFDEKIVEYLRKNKDKHFFLYHPSQLPHGVLTIPKIHESVVDNDLLTYSEKEYASMIIRLDTTVGIILDEIEKLGIKDNTMIVFCSDNGHCSYYAAERGVPKPNTIDGRKVNDLDIRYTSKNCGDIFDGNNGMTGCKSSNFEGGTRIPYAVKLPNVIKAGVKSDKIIANYDFLSTMADMLDVTIPDDKDGKSFLKVLLDDEDNFDEHDYIVYGSSVGPALVTKDGWKIRSYMYKGKYHYGLFGAKWENIKGKVEFELYNVKEDYMEENNMAKENPEKLKQLKKLLIKECDGNLGHGTTQWHFAFYGN